MVSAQHRRHCGPSSLGARRPVIKVQENLEHLYSVLSATFIIHSSRNLCCSVTTAECYEWRFRGSVTILKITVAAGEIGNNHLGVCKQPYSPRLLCDYKSCMCMQNWLNNLEPITSHRNRRRRPKRSFRILSATCNCVHRSFTVQVGNQQFNALRRKATSHGGHSLTQRVALVFLYAVYQAMVTNRALVTVYHAAPCRDSH